MESKASWVDGGGKKMFNNKIVNIIFSILVAVGLWVYVVGEVNPETTGKFQDLPVRFINASVLAEDGLALADPGNPTVTVVISGNRADMKSLTESEIDITADLSGLVKGENQIELNVSLPNDMKLQSISSGKVRVTIESLVTAEKSVQIKYQGNIPDGKEPGDISILPPTVQVSGAVSSIEKVQYLEAVVSVGDLKATPQELDAGLMPVDKDGKPISYLFLSQKQVKIDVTLLDLKTVPLNVEITGSVPNGYILDSKTKPETITIKGTSDEISKIVSVAGAPIDISGETDSVSIPIQLALPEGIEVANASANPTLQLVIDPETIKTFTYDASNLIINGLLTGLAVDLPTQSILLTVQSSADAAVGLAAKDFTLSLNLEGLKAGTYRVPILVETQKAGLTNTTTPKEIQIIIREE
jgi:YbbR domain-containing protein